MSVKSVFLEILFAAFNECVHLTSSFKVPTLIPPAAKKAIESFDGLEDYICLFRLLNSPTQSNLHSKDKMQWLFIFFAVKKKSMFIYCQNACVLLLKAFLLFFSFTVKYRLCGDLE